jgi:RimJ/RimL family protein N-acetyltransferase
MVPSGEGRAAPVRRGEAMARSMVEDRPVPRADPACRGRARAAAAPSAAPGGDGSHFRLVTERLLLRPAAVVDLSALVAVFRSNPAYLRTMGAGFGRFDSADAERYLGTETGRANGACLVLVERATRAVIGSAALTVPNPADGIPWIGLLIIRSDCQGRGLGREAATAIERRLARYGWPEVRLAVLASNPRARRFWERLGYRQVDGPWRAYDGRARAGATLGKALTRRRASA